MKIIKGVVHTITTRTQDKFESEDGTIFHSEEAALKYESNLKIKSILIEKYKIKDIEDPDIYGINANGDYTVRSIFISDLSEETLNDLKSLLPYIEYDRCRLLKDFKLGVNIIIEDRYETCGLSKWSGYSLYIHHIDDLIDEQKLKMSKIDELKNNYIINKK